MKTAWIKIESNRIFLLITFFSFTSIWAAIHFAIEDRNKLGYVIAALIIIANYVTRKHKKQGFYLLWASWFLLAYGYLFPKGISYSSYPNHWEGLNGFTSSESALTMSDIYDLDYILHVLPLMIGVLALIKVTSFKRGKGVMGLLVATLSVAPIVLLYHYSDHKKTAIVESARVQVGLEAQKLFIEADLIHKSGSLNQAKKQFTKIREVYAGFQDQEFGLAKEIYNKTEVRLAAVNEKIREIQRTRELESERRSFESQTHNERVNSNANSVKSYKIESTFTYENNFGGTCGNGSMFTGSVAHPSSGVSYMANTASLGSHFSYKSKDEAIRKACGE